MPIMTKDSQIKKIITGETVRKKILSGITITNQVVSTTLGSRGRNVAYELNWGDPNIIHDGVTVAKQIVLEDPFENQAAQLMIKAAQKTNTEAGDGTTTATILTYAIAKEGIKNVSANINPMIIRKGIDAAVEAITIELKRISKPVKTLESMAQVATVSAANAEIGTLIANTISKVGEHGVVTVQDGMTSDIFVDYKDGMEFDKGMLAPYQMTTSNERLEAILGNDKENPYIIIFNDRLNLPTLVKLLTPIYKESSSAHTIIIADEFEPMALQTMIANKLRNGISIVGVESPEFGNHRINLLNDIAVVTGGKVIGGVGGVSPDQTTIGDYGRADKVIAESDKTVIVGGKGDNKDIKARISGLQKQIKNEKVVFTKDKLQGRLSRLIGGVAVINVGANSETEQRELKERVIDAVNATRAAIEHGIVAGGGVALLRASKVLDKLKLSPKEMIGVDIVKEACKYPMRKLVQNAGVEDSGIILGEILKSDNQNIGYNVDTEAFEDVFVSGIIDPVKVTISALHNASSIAIMLLTTEVMMTFNRNPYNENNKKEDDDLGIGYLD